MAFGVPSVQMGFVGYCQFAMSSGTYQVRATSCDLNLSQPLKYEKTIDSRYDRNVYNVLPEVVEGGVSYPIVLSEADNDPTEALYKAAVYRTGLGRLEDFKVKVKHSASNASFKYTGCYVNTFGLRAEAGSTIDVSVDIIGKNRVTNSIDREPSSNARIATWNDFTVDYNGAEKDVDSIYFTEFSVDISNNIERFYTAGGLKVKDLSPRHREVSGSLKTLGRVSQWSKYAQGNPSRCAEESYIRFGYQTLCGRSFLALLPNVVSEIEEVALANDSFTTTVKWHSYPTNHDLSPLDDSNVIPIGI